MNPFVCAYFLFHLVYFLSKTMNEYLREINRLCTFPPNEDRSMNTDVFQLFDKIFILIHKEFDYVSFLLGQVVFIFH